MSYVRLVAALSLAAVISTFACSPKYGGSAAEYTSKLGDGADLSKYHTWSFVPTTHLPTGDPRLSNPAFAAAFERGVEREMVARGFEKAESAPDMIVNYQIDVERKMGDDEWTEYYADQKFSQPDLPWEEGSILIILFDSKDGKALWGGRATGELDPKATDAQRRERIQDVIRRIMLRFDIDRGAEPAQG
jgi:hypothetical protein